MIRSDAALEKFDRLRVREVVLVYEDTPALFLAKFQSTAASLRPDERIKVDVTRGREGNIEFLKAVLADPQTNKICAVHWAYNGNDDVASVIPLLTNNCPELASLLVYFKRESMFDFVSSVLKHPSTKIKVLQTAMHTGGNIPRFFAALGQSQVSAFHFWMSSSPEFSQGVYDYLAKDLLVRLRIDMNRKKVPFEMVTSLAKCTRLVELRLAECTLSEPISFPQPITKLAFYECMFVGDVDWSFLVGSGVQELDFDRVTGVDGPQLGSDLSVCLRARGLDKLRFVGCDFADETLAAIGVELGRVKRLEIDRVNDAQIALVLQSLHCEMRELKLRYDGGTSNHLVFALKHPNCRLAKLSFGVDEEHARRVEDRFHYRRAVFALLQGQQVRKQYCPLRRLPVEMFRMVGEVLL